MNVSVPTDVLLLPPEQTFETIRQLLLKAGENDDDDDWYARWWAADALTLMGRYGEAVEIHPRPSTGKATLQVERLLSLKVAAGLPYNATDALALLGPRLTKYGRENAEAVQRAAELLVDEDSDAVRTDRLKAWAEKASQRPYQVYLGSSAGYRASDLVAIPHFELSMVDEAGDFCYSLARKAENMVREDAGLPRVGEGWVSETRLFHELREAFPEHAVEQHASPQWLGRQHLDVYFPQAAIGVEYQGVQHDRPVEFFGGQDAYEAVQRRDARKLRLCKRNGVELVYVRPGYDLAQVVGEIKLRALQL